MMRTARAAALVAAVVLGGWVAGAARPATAAPPAGKEVAEVLVSGNRVRASGDIVAVFGLRPGQPYIEENIRSGTRRHTNSCYFTMIAVDDAGRPVEVPPLTLETPVEHRRHAAAAVRRGLGPGTRVVLHPSDRIADGVRVRARD